MGLHISEIRNKASSVNSLDVLGFLAELEDDGEVYITTTEEHFAAVGDLVHEGQPGPAALSASAPSHSLSVFAVTLGLSWGLSVALRFMVYRRLVVR